MRHFAAATLALLAASCGNSKPCTTCINVMGTYRAVVESKQGTTSSCSQMYFNGGEWDVDLYQQGSALDAPGLFGMKGTLYEDNGARFGPVKMRIAYADNLADVTVSGGFDGEEANRQFGGSLTATAVLDGQNCTLNAPVRMTKKTAP